MEEIVTASWSLFQHDGAAPFKLSESKSLPPAGSAKDLPGGRTLIFHVRQIWRINSHPDASDKDSTPERILDTANCLNWNAYINHPNSRDDNCTDI
jgi:hypothetical protein